MKPSEIFDTPEATGFSRVVSTPRICTKTGIHTCRLGSIHLNERDKVVLEDWLTNTLTQHHQDRMSEAVEKIGEMKEAIDTPIGEYSHYEVESKIEEALTEAQNIIKSK